MDVSRIGHPVPPGPVEDSASRTALVVIGAAVGMGRWLVDHLFARLDWLTVTLVDVDERKNELAEAAASFAPPVRTIIATPELGNDIGPAPAPGKEATPTLIVIAVPLGEVEGVVRRLIDLDLSSSTVTVVSDRLVAAMGIVGSALKNCHCVGMHPLFERTATSIEGQIIYVVPPERNGITHAKLTDIIRAAGGVVNVGTAQRHDEIMKYVQAGAHQTLLNFVDVLTRSGLDLEKDLWAARTPLYEALFGLATRVLDPRQRSAIEQIQSTPGAREVAAELLSSAACTSTSIADGDTTASRLDGIGRHVSGSMFSTARHVAQVAVTAAQATRTELSRRRAAHDLVGVRLDRRPEMVHIGHIIDIGPTDLVIDDLYLPGSGRGAVLATGPGLTNGTRVGARGGPKRVVLNIGQITLLTGSDLERELDLRLAFIRRDVRFLVPESVSGVGVLRAIIDTAGTRGHMLLSEVVRTGQRAVVIRLEIRADRDLDEMVEQLRAAVQQIYAWPGGICRPATDLISRVAFLGPPGTFSEIAAQQCARAAQIRDPRLTAADNFAGVLGELTGDAIAVIPIGSSSSGLVSRAFRALWDGGGDLTIGGMVDVSVRIDAYISTDSTLEELRGANLYSHPQAIAQCSQFIRRWNLKPIPCTSTVEALQIAAASQTSSVALAAAGIDPGDLAIKVGESEVDDLSGSITRFLIVGPANAFSEFSDEYLPTTRTVLLGRRIDGAPAGALSLAYTSAAYEEVLADAEGHVLVITSRSDTEGLSGLRRLGTTPWSPRTPVVRVSASQA